jgi:sodium-dependent phosphate cotransporter
MKTFLKVVAVIGLLYCFLLSIGLMESAFRLFGEGFALGLFKLASNRFVGLFIGVMTTSLVQSSSFTTCIAVGLVAGGMLDVSMAVPIIMGANVGTAITNTLVAYGHFTRKEELQRGMEAGNVHDIFNILSVIILFPLEMKFGFLEKMAREATTMFGGIGGVTFTSPIKAIIKPASKAVCNLVVGTVSAPAAIQASIILVLSVVLLFLSLFFIVRVLKSLMLARLEVFFRTYIFRNAAISMFVGLAITAVVQSSSVTTSLIVPMAAAGILTLEQVYPFTLGANVGTTVTAMLASLATVSATNMGGVTIAFTHLMFNLTGIAILYPLRFIPIAIAREFGQRATKNRLLPLQYIILVFFYIPGTCIYLSEFGLTLVGGLLIAGLPVLLLVFAAISRAFKRRQAQ